MNKLSVTIITFNEEARIGKCLKSIQSIADEIIVVDSFSTDNTVVICKQYGARVIQREWTNFGDSKRFAVASASFDRILSLDADEVLSPELHQSILKVKEHWNVDAYTFNRLNFVGEKAIRHGVWYPDVKIRLFDRRKANWENKRVHESVAPETHDCKVSHLSGDLLHYSYKDIDDLRKSSKAKLYTGMYVKKKTIPKLLLLLKISFVFIQTYFLKLGFLDGKAGYEIAKFRVRYIQLKYSSVK
ncbi:MAG: glycosyltransferase family 2 protein [Dysgonamonadaceae bacterium]|jgi:glycosyltransferase involved in cell wall biosynthesis|nr:glycosyltransferase family 2 protein [Dysgonamonadaceae bacterium]